MQLAAGRADQSARRSAGAALTIAVEVLAVDRSKTMEPPIGGGLTQPRGTDQTRSSAWDSPLVRSEASAAFARRRRIQTRCGFTSVALARVTRTLRSIRAA